MAVPIRETVCFGQFELDLGAYELRRGGLSLKVSRQQMELLILLIERRTQLVSRAEISDRLWTSDVFVDVDTGINSAISKIRQALGDSAETPRFVETVPGKGYRFIADVVVKDLTPANVVLSDALEHRGAEDRRHPGWLAAAAGIALIAAVPAAYMAWRHSPAALMNSRVAIAVLPFEHLGEPASGYLAEGLTSETSASLAQIDPERLSVKGRTLAYKGTRKSAAEIGRELSADYLVEGTIRSAGHRVRVTTQLLRVRDQEHVWSASYERESGNLLALQQELSSAIAEQIRHRVSAEPLRGALGRRHTHDPDAYEAYLKARSLQGRRTPATNTDAVREFERALGRDPSYALAWAGLALTHAASVLNGDAPPREVATRAREAAARAVMENANLAEVQMAVAYVNWLFEWDWSAAAAAAERATRLDPSSGAAWRTLGHVISQSGRHAEAAASMARARELEPLEPMSYALSSQVAFQARDYKVALDHARRAVVTDSDIWVGHMMLGQAYDRLGMTDLALEALADAARLSQGNSKPVSLRGYILATAGRTGEAREVLRTLQARAERQYVPPYALALVHAGLADRDAVFDQLSNAVAGRDVHLILLGVEAKWDPYRADPRFADLLARCAFNPPLSVRR